MDIRRKLKEAQGLTPTEAQLAATVLAMGEQLQEVSIKEFARASACSIASIHRFCKKLGLEGFKELKVELARAEALRPSKDVDINFPFSAGDKAASIGGAMQLVYETTLRETREVLEASQMDRAARILQRCGSIDIYTASHNLYPARMFRERLLSAGFAATCEEQLEGQIRCALASGPDHASLCISYSGLAPNLSAVLPILCTQKSPIIMVGSPQCARRHPGYAAYLLVSDREDLRDRITQFASHIAVQYVLDTLYSCLFALDYDKNMAFLARSLPYTKLPGA